MTTLGLSALAMGVVTWIPTPSRRKNKIIVIRRACNIGRFPIPEEVFTGLIFNKLAIKKLLSSLPQGNRFSIPDCPLESLFVLRVRPRLLIYLHPLAFQVV